MTLQELYGRIGGSYEAARRILPMDTLISKFIIRLLSDGSCGRLMEAYAHDDARGIFEAAHSMKGVYANLGLLELSSMSSARAIAAATSPSGVDFSMRPLALVEMTGLPFRALFLSSRAESRDLFFAGRSNSSQKKNQRMARALKTTLTDTRVKIQPCGSRSAIWSDLDAAVGSPL